MKAKILTLIMLGLCLAGSGFSQTVGENLLDKVEIKFDLQGEPTDGDVGFNDPKSVWKIEYRLYLSDWDSLKKIGRCGVRQSPETPAYCTETIDKNPDKKVKKISQFMARGKFVRTQLASSSNREILETVKFTPEIIAAFNDAAKVYEKNPVFVFFVKTSISTRSAGGKKFKGKFMTEGLHWLKIYKPEHTFNYWNLSKLSFSLGIAKESDGSLSLRKGYGHFGL